MKEILWSVLAFGLVFAGASGCTPKEASAPQESAAILEIPAQEAVLETPAQSDVVAVPVQEAAEILEESVSGDGVASAVQSSTQALIREGNMIVGGVASAAQASSQAANLEENALAEKIEAPESPVEVSSTVGE